MKHPWLLLESGPSEAAFNMALDEALLEAALRTGVPVLRFYGWTEPAASFGYFQKYADVERLTLLRPLVRRPTGGGIVPHDADRTYSLAFPAGHEWHGLRAVESYRRVHEWIRRAFARLSVETVLAPEARTAGAGQCFAGYEQSDVLWNGQKIAGAAQRRTRTGLLIQGSVQPPPRHFKFYSPLTPTLSPEGGEGAGKGVFGASPHGNSFPNIERNTWEQAMRESADAGISWVKLQAEGNLINRANELARLKYSRPDYNQRR